MGWRWGGKNSPQAINVQHFIVGQNLLLDNAGIVQEKPQHTQADIAIQLNGLELKMAFRSVSITLRNNVVAPSDIVTGYPSNMDFIFGPQLILNSASNPWQYYDNNILDRGALAGDWCPSVWPLPPAASGTVTVTNGSKSVTGVGTQFLTEFSRGSWLYVQNDSATGFLGKVFIDSVNSNTSLTLTANWPHATGSGRTIQRDTVPYPDFWNQLAGYTLYYDLAKSQYIAYYRTGNNTFLNYARKIADLVYKGQYENGTIAGGDNGFGSSPRAANIEGLILRAFDGKPEYWDFIERYTDHHFNVWIYTKRNNANLHYGIRDGAFCTLFTALLAKLLPDTYRNTANTADVNGAAKRATYLSKLAEVITNYYQRLQWSDGGWYYPENWAGFGQGANGDYATTVFHTGYLQEALILCHKLFLDSGQAYAAEAEACKNMLLRSTIWTYNQYRQEFTNIANLRMRSVWYIVFRPDMNKPPTGGNSQTIGGNRWIDDRQTNSMHAHVFGYAYRLTGDPSYIRMGDDLFSATYGWNSGPGSDGKIGLMSDLITAAQNNYSRVKEYNQGYRSSGRYLAWRHQSLPSNPWPVELPQGITYDSYTNSMVGTVFSTPLDITYFSPTTRTVITIKNSGGTYTPAQFQTALNNIARGQILVIDNDVTITGNFTLPSKAGTDQIYIMSASAYNGTFNVKEGDRVLPADKNSMPIIQTANSSSILTSNNTADCSYYRFVGLSFRVSPSYTNITYNMIFLGSASIPVSSMPHNIIFDRCHFAAHTNMTSGIQRAVAINNGATAFLGCRFEQCAGIGFDSQCVAGWGGIGPFKFINCFLEGAGENFMYGGADPSNQVLAKNFEFRKCHFYKPLTWMQSHPTYANKAWTIKNLFETKHGTHWLIEDCVFENNWTHAQTGVAIVLKSSNQDGGFNKAECSHLTFRYNKIINFGSGLLTANDLYNGGTLIPIHDLYIDQNLWIRGDDTYFTGGGRITQLSTGAQGIPCNNIKFNHNTYMQATNKTSSGILSIFVGTEKMDGFEFKNNLASMCDYGVTHDQFSVSEAGLYEVTNNPVWIKNASPSTSWWTAATWPINGSQNFFPANNAAIGWYSYATIDSDFRLQPTSPFKNAASDGTDIGCNVSLLDQRIKNVREIL